MEVKDILKRIDGEIVSDNSAIVKQDENEYTVTISVNNNLCTINVFTLCTVSDRSEEIVRLFSKNDDIVRYYLEENGIVLKTTMWVDRKPTLNALTDMVNILITKTNNAKNLIEAIR